MALKQPYGSGLAAGRLRESRAVRPGSRTRGGRVNGQAGEVGMGGFLLSNGHQSCGALHCRLRWRHRGARRESGSDGLIVNSTELLARDSVSRRIVEEGNSFLGSD